MSAKTRRFNELIGSLLTLTGSIIGIIGTTLTWAVEISHGIPALGMALYVSPRAGRLNAFQLKIGSLSVGWLLVMLSAVCGFMLLARPQISDKPQFFLAQSVVGAILLCVAIVFFQPQPGIAMSFCSGTMLIAGAYLRYR